MGESVIIRYDPRDMAEIRIFHDQRFLWRAICTELAGETVALRDIVQARNRRRRDLRHTLQDRARLVEVLLDAHRGGALASEPLATSDFASPAEPPTGPMDTPRLKRYFNE